jgi:signal transduction histidine kinase
MRRRALHIQLAVGAAGLLFVVGALVIALTVVTGARHADEARQRLDAGIAMYVVDQMQLLSGGNIDFEQFQLLQARAMTINPSAEVYLLDPSGGIIAPRGTFERQALRLDPIETYLRDSAKRPIYGDDPKSSRRARVFSTAPILEDGALRGYLYVVLGGRPARSITEEISGSYAIRFAVAALATLMAATCLAAAVFFNALTRPLRQLERRMASWSTKWRIIAGPSPEIAGNEIDQLQAQFAAMSRSIEYHLAETQAADQRRRDFLASVAHDLRTPLAALRGFVETARLRADQRDHAELSGHLDIALRQAELINRLIESLFELARLESGAIALRLETAPIAELVQDMADRYRGLADERAVSLRTALDPDVLVSADLHLIERVLGNLFENALRHTPPEGTVEVSLRTDQDRVYVAVTDTGSGFDPVQSTTSQDGRTGLGLSIVRRILDLHGQSVSIRRADHGGAVVEFSLERVRGVDAPAPWREQLVIPS